MDINGVDFIRLWQCLNNHNVRYITVGELAVALHGFNNFSVLFQYGLMTSQKIVQA